MQDGKNRTFDSFLRTAAVVSLWFKRGLIFMKNKERIFFHKNSKYLIYVYFIDIIMFLIENITH